MKKLALVIAAIIALAIPTLAQDATKEEVFDQAIVDTALREVGTVKQVGYDSPKVKEYVETTDQEADEYYQDGWCNAFVSWVLKKCGYQFASLNSVDQIGHYFHQVSTPKIGDLVTLTGHICFYFGKAPLPGYDGAILILGGNQGHAVNVLPIQSRFVVAYWEPVKADTGWTPSRHLAPDTMSGFNRIDDKGYIADILEHSLKTSKY